MSRTITPGMHGLRDWRLDHRRWISHEGEEAKARTMRGQLARHLGSRDKAVAVTLPRLRFLERGGY